MIAFNCGFWWRKWGLTTTTNGENEMGVFFFSLFWPVTVSIYLMWCFGNYLVKKLAQ
jgi:hypothetical protein